MEVEEVQAPLVVSAILVSYNCAPALRRSLEALERSSMRAAMEILVVDAGSRDESSRMDEEFPEITVLRLPRNFGLTKARNIGARTAKGEFLLFVEPDIEVEPDTVAGLAARLQADPACVIACPLLVDASGRPVSRIGELPAPADLVRAWSRGECFSRVLPGSRPAPESALEQGEILTSGPDPRAMLVRCQFLRGMNYFDEKYGQFGSTLQLLAQVETAGKKIVLLAAVKALSREGEGLYRPETVAARADLAADCAAGIVRYARYFGWQRALALRLKILALAAVRALGALLTLREPAFHLGVLSRLLAGFKIDGAQTGF
jgi:glycosyltransferase involved in cell wall biosynthesis